MKPSQTYNGKPSSYLALFVPSALELVIVVTATAVIMLSPLLPGVKEYLAQAGNFNFFHWVFTSLDKVLTSIIGESRTEVVVVGAFWAVVGLVVYAFLRGLARFVSELDDDVSIRHYVWPKGMDRSRPLHLTLKRTFLRIIAVVLLLIVIAGPLDAVIHGPVLRDFFADNDIVAYIVWGVASILVLHLMTILLRLTALRARLVG